MLRHHNTPKNPAIYSKRKEEKIKLNIQIFQIIHQINAVLLYHGFHTVLTSIAIFNIDNNNKRFLSTKSA